jgi:uncharacterized protein (DUF2344 family)
MISNAYVNIHLNNMIFSPENVPKINVILAKDLKVRGVAHVDLNMEIMLRLFKIINNAKIMGKLSMICSD